MQQKREELRRQRRQKVQKREAQSKKEKGKVNKTIMAVIFGLAASSAVMAQGRVTVKVTERQDNNVAYNYVFVSGYTGVEQNLNLRGATLTLQLPNGDTAVVNCSSKFQERFAGPGNVRSCRVPLVDSFEADFNGDKAKLMWPVSLDGKKTASETYKIIAVFKGK